MSLLTCVYGERVWRACVCVCVCVCVHVRASVSVCCYTKYTNWLARYGLCILTVNLEWRFGGRGSRPMSPYITLGHCTSLKLCFINNRAIKLVSQDSHLHAHTRTRPFTSLHKAPDHSLTKERERELATKGSGLVPAH